MAHIQRLLMIRLESDDSGENDVDDTLVIDRVRELVDQGFSSGYQPTWAIAERHVFAAGDRVRFAHDGNHAVAEVDLVLHNDYLHGQLLQVCLDGSSVKLHSSECTPV